MEQLFGLSFFAFLAILAGLYFLAVPLITKATFQMEARTTLVLEETSAGLDEQADRYLTLTNSQLVQLGFEPVCLVSVPHMMTNVKAWLKLFIHPENDDSVMVELFFVQQGDQWKLQNECVEFCAEYGDGSEISTGNQKVLTVWPLDEHKTMSMFPNVDDLEWLYGAHLAICRTVARGKRKQIDLYSKYNGDAVACLADALSREHVPAVEAGYLYYRSYQPAQGDQMMPNPYAPPSSESMPASYGATWKGAYLMTWQLLWPISWIVKRRRVRRSYRRLREAGFV